jgi:hypothetical protein
MGFQDWLTRKDGASAWVKADNYRVARDFAVSAVVGTAVVAAAVTFGAPVLAALVVGGVVGSLAVYGIEHMIHHEAVTPRGLLFAGAIGAVGGLLGGVAGSTLGSLGRSVLGSLVDTPVGTAAVSELAEVGNVMGRGAAGVLGGGRIHTGAFKTHVGDAKSERGIATGVSPYEQAAEVYDALPELERRPEKLTAEDLRLFQYSPTSRTGVANVPPPGTANVVIGVVLPSSYAPEGGLDHNAAAAPRLARDYHATLIMGDPDRDYALTRADIEKALSGVANDNKIHALQIVGHSGIVPSDRDEAFASLGNDKDAALANLPVWGGVGVVIGAAGHRETLVPGLQTILEQVAAEHGVAVSDLFSKDAVIEFVDCQVGKNSVWMQDLANMTGARVVAYKNDVNGMTAGSGWVFRGIDDGAVHPQPEDGRVEFTPQASRTKGFVNAVGE